MGTAAAQNLLSPAEATVYEGDKLADEGAWCWFADPRALHSIRNNFFMNMD